MVRSTGEKSSIIQRKVAQAVIQTVHGAVHMAPRTVESLLSGFLTI